MASRNSDLSSPGGYYSKSISISVYGNPSSGNGHSERHARETGLPLVVKLGTIESDGKADVYQYEFNSKGEDVGNSVKVSGRSVQMIGLWIGE